MLDKFINYMTDNYEMSKELANILALLITIGFLVIVIQIMIVIKIIPLNKPEQILTLEQFKNKIITETLEYERVINLKFPKYTHRLFKVDPPECPNCHHLLKTTWRMAHQHIYYLCPRCGYEYVEDHA